MLVPKIRRLHAVFILSFKKFLSKTFHLIEITISMATPEAFEIDPEGDVYLICNESEVSKP